jgi:ABC-type nitrate/sulfonate/bicarbonate transport system substrate-binding protein
MPNSIKLAISLIAIATILPCGCGRQTASDERTPAQAQPPSQTQTLTKFTITIDWIPAPEYYGFFYARQKGIYKDVGLDVEIRFANGAPEVAKELAVGNIYAGTTTSDNLLRQVADGAEFSFARPLLKFNPCVLASLAKSPITKLEDIREKIIGTNPQSSVYQQFLYLLKQHNISKSSFKQYPIGWGGAAQLKAGDVDAILAYTSNVVIDLEKDKIPVTEIFFGDLGVESYGVVLAVGSEKLLAKNGISAEQARKFAAATIAGYEMGYQDVPGAVAALQAAEPTLEKTKVEFAIRKIGKLNARFQFVSSNLDRWVEDSNITEESRSATRRLFE